MAPRRQRAWGVVYRRRSRGRLTKWWWLLVQFPGELVLPRPSRHLR